MTYIEKVTALTLKYGDTLVIQAFTGASYYRLMHTLYPFKCVTAFFGHIPNEYNLVRYEITTSGTPGKLMYSYETSYSDDIPDIIMEALLRP